MSNVTYEVEAGMASETSTGVDRGIDVDFSLTLSGLRSGPMCDVEGCECRTCAECGACNNHGPACDCETVIEGEVTLLPNEDGSPGYSSWGMVDHWLDGRTVATLRKLSSDDHTDVCTAIIEATAPVARAFAG